MAVYRELVFITVLFTSAAVGATSYAPSESELAPSPVGDEHNLTSENATQEPESVSGLQDVADSMRLLGLEVLQNKTELSVSARMKMSDLMLNPMMFVPQLIMWGFAPILLANLKMFVMQALMLNKMALSSAIFMTLRNIVFGPRPGPIVKYANYGYGHGHGHEHGHEHQNKVYHHHGR